MSVTLQLDNLPPQVKQVLEAGGTLLTCTSCQQPCVLMKTNPLSVQTRKALGVRANEPCIAEVNICPLCPRPVDKGKGKGS